ncbi:MAG: hypothetical protein JWR84_3663 [Caulobacter sp.]|nr:hypothetical protein [Caulobacter sp.]
MAQLDIGKTATAGFGVIGRQPLSPLIWGLVTLVLSVGPMLLVLPAMAEFFRMAIEGAQNNAPANSEEMMRVSSQMNAVTPLTWITGLLAYALTTGALFRVMLKPDDKSWFYMRISMAEVMLVAVTIVFAILFFMALLVVAVIVAIVATIAWQASEAAGITTAIILGLAAFGVLLWGALRFSLAFAMSWERKQFLLFESWTLTKGHGLQLFLAGLLNFLIMILLSLLLAIVVGGTVIGLLAASGALGAISSGDPASYFTPERIISLWPLALVWFVLASIVQSYTNVIQTAPWAEAYRELVNPTEDVF